MTVASFSALAIVTAAVLYLLALVFHTLEWAMARNVEAAVTESVAADGKGGVALLDKPSVEPVPPRKAVVLAALYFLGVWKWGLRWLGLPVTLLGAILNGLAATVFYVAVAPLVPALHSVWFMIHILAAIVSGAAFSIGGVAAILYLIQSRAERKGTVKGYLARLPTADGIDRMGYRLLAFAFPLWTFTIAAGAIWAEYAWGRYWGWDPKETWSLVTWVIFAGYLHA